MVKLGDIIIGAVVLLELSAFFNLKIYNLRIDDAENQVYLWGKTTIAYSKPWKDYAELQEQRKMELKYVLLPHFLFKDYTPPRIPLS